MTEPQRLIQQLLACSCLMPRHWVEGFPEPYSLEWLRQHRERHLATFPDLDERSRHNLDLAIEWKERSLAEGFVPTREHSPMQLWDQANKEANGDVELRVAVYNLYMRQAGHIIRKGDRP